MKNTRDAIPPLGAVHGYAVGDYVINRHTNRMCKVLRADDDGGCVLDTYHGPLYHSATLMEGHWKPHNPAWQKHEIRRGNERIRRQSQA